MKKQHSESVKLGVFVLTGLLIIIVSLYIIGTNKGFFSDNFVLKTRFRAVNGLLTGNNVRFAGIDVGAVKAIVFINDTTVEVTMNVDKKMHTIIRTNALTKLGTDGLIGNRVVNIMPERGAAPFVKAGDLLASREETSTDAMLTTLSKTNENIAEITEELRTTIHNISSSTQLSQLLNDPGLTQNLKASLIHLHETTQKASAFMTDANQTLALASTGKGTLATILTDTSLAVQVRQAVQKIKTVEESADLLARNMDKVVQSMDKDLNSGNGTVHTLLQDSLMAAQLRNTVLNVEQGTAAFNQNMEALKHNFLFRRYFKKLEKKQQQ